MKPKKPIVPEEETGTSNVPIIAAIIAGVCGIIAAVLAAIFGSGDGATPTITTDPPSSTVNPGCPSAGVGNPIGDISVFFISENYDPSGLMGDIGDISIASTGRVTTFTYETEGRGPHEWDWKYVEDEVNPVPAQFGGVMFLYPPNNWGDTEGFNLSGMTSVSWEARSLDGDVWVEFLIGGVRRQWDGDPKELSCVPVPDSMPRVSLGKYRVTSSSQSFEVDLSNLPEKDFENVIGGFGWTVSWGPNEIELNDDRTGPVESRSIEIEVTDIQYEGREVGSS